MPYPTLPPTAIVAPNTPAWGLNLRPVGCAQCGQILLLPVTESTLPQCPLCRRGTLAPQSADLSAAPPELMVPFVKQPADVRLPLANFASLWLAPNDLTVDNLLKRIQPIFWPMWLVDAEMEAQWEAEVGFDYQVKSSREKYGGEGWKTEEIVETRIRWEPRVGQLHRPYHNAHATAFTGHAKRLKLVGRYPLEKAQAFDPALLGAAFCQVPDRPPTEAWPEAEQQFRERAAAECQQAATAQHIRNFTARADYQALNWTLLLLPLYVTWYKADDGDVQVVYLNGYSGVVGGKRLASQNAGWAWGGSLAGLAVIMFLVAALSLAVGAIFPPALVISGLIGLVALGLGLGAIVPFVWPMWWNRGQA